MTAPTAAEAPYAVFRPYGQPQYFKTFKQARNAIMKDLDSLRDTWLSLCATDAVEATSLLEQQCLQLSSNGGRVDGVTDPYTRQRYHADLVKRGD